MNASEIRWAVPWPGNELAAEAERSGAAAFCSGEFADHNAYAMAAEMALGSTRALIGPGIAYAFARSPFVHASAARHLHSSAPGRVFLGLGAGTARMNADWFGVDSSRPVARMAELVQAIRAFLHAENGETVRFDGDFYRISARILAPVLGFIDVPIILGATNRNMLRLAGRVADGVLGHALFTDRWWEEVVDPALEHGARETDRDGTTLRRWGWTLVSINDEDPDRAIIDAKRQLAFYLTVKTYDPLFSLHGWHEAAVEVRNAFAQNPADIHKHVPDDMVASIALCGTAEQARQTLAQRTHLPDMVFLSPPGFMVGTRRRSAYTAASIAFGQANLAALPA